MASLSIDESITRTSRSSETGWKWIASGDYTDVEAKATCAVSYNSTSKTYTVGQVYLYLRRTSSSSLAVVTECTIRSISSGSGSGWTSYNFKPNKSVGSTISSSSITTSGGLAVQYSASTVSVSDTYTNNYKDATATLSVGFSMKLYNSDGTTSLKTGSVTINLDYRLYGGKPIQYSVSYYQNSDFGGGLISSSSFNAGTSVTVRGAYSRSLSSTDIPRYVYFDMRGWTPSQDTRDKSTSQTRKYVFLSWSGKQPTTSFIVNSNTTLVEQYDITYGTITYKTVGSLPTVYKKGYVKTNTWYDENNSAVDASIEVSENLTLHPESERQIYQIKFNLNGGNMPEDMGKITDYTIDKTYEVNTQKTPAWIPTRLGYKFVGWSDQNRTITPVMNDSIVGDNFYNAINTEYTNNSVTLYAQWDYNVNTVECKYYLTDTGAIQTDTHTYNIDTSTLDSQGDKAFLKYAPSKLRSGDYVFLGWLDTMPDGWEDSSLVNKGYHGTYAVPPERIVDSQGHKIEIELPIDIKIKNYKTLSDWGITERYYGIWAKTGKYIKINNSWKKANKCFVKIGGLWKTVTDIWTKQNGTWKHEI